MICCRRPSTVTLDAEQVLLLKQAAESEGLDPDRALAEAVAMGECPYSRHA